MIRSVVFVGISEFMTGKKWHWEGGPSTRYKQGGSATRRVHSWGLSKIGKLLGVPSYQRRRSKSNPYHSKCFEKNMLVIAIEQRGGVEATSTITSQPERREKGSKRNNIMRPRARGRCRGSTERWRHCWESCDLSHFSRKLKKMYLKYSKWINWILKCIIYNIYIM